MVSPEKNIETARQYAEFEQSARYINEFGRTYDPNKSLEISVDQYLTRFGVESKPIVDIMHLYPVLVYGLGRWENGKIVDGTGVWNAPAEVTIQNKGLIRHSVGLAVRAPRLAELLHTATDAQLVPFKKLGFHTEFLRDLPSLAIRDECLISHMGDLIAKQIAQQTGKDISEAWLDRGPQMDVYLKKEHAHPILQHLLASEICHVADRKGEMPTFAERFAYPHIIAIQVPDWWYDVKPIETERRLMLISQAKRAIRAARYLPILLNAGLRFNAALREAFGAKAIHEIQHADDPPWAQEILDAYAAQVGRTQEQLFSIPEQG